MKRTTLKYIWINCLVFLMSTMTFSQNNSGDTLNFNDLSEEFLTQIKAGKNTKTIQDKFSNTTLTLLESNLKTDEDKLAFWINIYNGYIQVLLTENPELYDDRGTFFKKEQIPIAGRLLSFDKIEHGIIRKSQWKLGLGLIRKWFPNKFERQLRVDERDYRIHFAINCGAKDCPPVAIYNPKDLDNQLEKSTKMYLQKTSEYDSETQTATVTSLFNWFRGDFGCKSGVKNILKTHGIIETTKNIDITYKSYDWTLDLDNWISL